MTGKQENEMKKRNVMAQALGNPLYRQRIVKDKTKYTRKNQKVEND